MFINILSTEYKIVICKELRDVTPSNKCDLDAQAFGTIDYINREIRVWDCDNKNEVFKTLLHEIIHGALNSLALNKVNDNETFIEQLTNILADTLIRNNLVKTEIY
jgi:hypothetical protein